MNKLSMHTHVALAVLLLVNLLSAHADTAKRFEAHMDFLASDLLLGRDTDSVGHEIAAQYIASEFAKMGIVPAGDDGYMQRIEFKSALLETHSPEFSFKGTGEAVHFEFLEEFSVSANINHTQSMVEGELVFAGFGIDAQHSSLWGVISEAAESNAMTFIPYPMPERNIFVRSDQYSFVKKGIPAAFLVTADNVGMEFEDHEIPSQEFVNKHYHKSSDQLDLPINYDVAAKFVEINRAIATEVVNAKERPSWNKDSFFATIDKD